MFQLKVLSHYLNRLIVRHGFWLFGFLIFFNPSVIFGAKTDIVVLLNGDNITCEIKEMKYGKIRVSTDDMGTVYIEWDKISSIKARQKFEVELQFGAIYFGSLGPAEDPRKMSVFGDSLTYELFRPFVVRLTPIKDTFLDRLDGSINLGLDYTKASEVLRLNVDGKVRHRSRIYETNISFSSIITEQPEKETSRRNDLSWTFTRYLGKRWVWGLISSLEQNSELGIDLRLSIGGGAGRRIIQTHHIDLSLFTGLNATREWIDDAPEQYSLEIPVTAMFAMFMYDNPKTDITTKVAVHPNITTLGRYRMELDSKLKRELITDLNWTFNVYVSYDNQPPKSDAAKSDYGVTLSFGYTF